MKFLHLRDHIYAMVDDEDYGLASQYKYYAAQRGRRIYAARRYQRNCVVYHTFLHHDVLGTTAKEIAPLVVDHKDRNPLNCCKGNLRLCTRAENNYNRIPNRNGTSKYKGVFYFSGKGGRDRLTKPWLVQLRKEGKTYYFGYFASEYQAAMMANVHAYRLFGRFAYLNNWTGPTPKNQIPGSDPPQAKERKIS